MAEKRNHTEKKSTKAKKIKLEDKICWSEEETSELIGLFEENSCLWNIHEDDYSKRDIKELAWSTIAEKFDTNQEAIKKKINGLRTQLGRELAHERTTKSGQSTDELYISQWAHYKELKFLVPIMGNNSKSRDTLSTDEDTTPKANKSKKSIAERKLELLSEATKAISSSTNDSVSKFACYVDEKLSRFDKATRMLAEKRINDILFETELNAMQIQANLYNNES